MKSALDRRHFLRLAGLGASSLFLPSLSNAQAPDPIQKRRILFIYAEGGWTNRFIQMRPPWAPPEWSRYNPYHPDFSLVPDELEWDYSLADARLDESHFSRVLKPFFRHRDQMIVTEGLAMLSTAIDPHGDGHSKGHIACMSGTATVSEFDGVKARAGTPSMDQRVNEFIRTTNPDHQSLDFRTFISDLFHEFVYRSDGNGGAVRLPVETDPAAAFGRLFSTPIGPDPNPLDLGRGAAFEAARKQYDRLATRLSGADRIKLESHRDMLSSLERKFGRTVSCTAPTRPANTEDLPGAERAVRDIEAFATMVAAAFGCGLSRVASIGVTGIPPNAYGLPAEASIHHEYEHKSSPFELYDAMGGNPTAEWAAAEEGMVKRNVWQAEQVAKVVDILRAVPEDGGSMLDSTLIVYVSELSHGGHGHEHWPVILFGGLAGAVTPGRYIKYKQNNPNPFNRNYMNEYTGTPHSHLFVSICQAFGMDVDWIGAPSVPGSVPHRNIEGTVSLTGPLPRLKV
jgi:hypothetical protein